MIGWNKFCNSPDQTWDVTFCFLVEEKAFENESLWHDEQFDVLEKTGPTDE